MKSVLILLLLVAFVVGGVFLAWNPETPVKVATVKAERGDIEAVLSTNGRIEAGSRYDVIAGTTGQVLQVLVTVGDVVKKGQALAVIDDSRARNELDAAQARLTGARAELASLQAGLPAAERADLESRAGQLESDLSSYRAELEQAQRLADKKAIPGVEVESLRRKIDRAEGDLALVRLKMDVEPDAAKVELAEARVAEAQAGVTAAQRQVGSSTVRAPIDGLVYSLSVERGMFVSPGAPVARVAGSEPPRARLLIDEPELGKVSLGDEALLTADAFPDQSWICRVDLLPTEVIEEGSRRVGKARCAVDVAASKGGVEHLIPNLTVDVAIVVDRVKGVVSLPREAVVRADGRELVWVAEQGLAHRKPVEVGLRGDERVEIRSGLAAGDQVLVPGPETLTEGAPVELEGT